AYSARLLATWEPHAYPAPAPTTPPTPAPMAAPRPPPTSAPTPAPTAAPAPVPSRVLSVVVRWVSERPAQPASSPMTSSILAVFRIMSSLLGQSSTVSASLLQCFCQGVSAARPCDLSAG